MHRDRQTGRQTDIRTDRPDEVNRRFLNYFANVPKNGPYQHSFTLLRRRILSEAQCDQSTAVKFPYRSLVIFGLNVIYIQLNAAVSNGSGYLLIPWKKWW
jgi:hypothetical protein